MEIKKTGKQTLEHKELVIPMYQLEISNVCLV